jgi:hypothetical protein
MLDLVLAARELGKSVEGFWYVFAERQRKYPKGKRPSRSTGTAGRWKTVGKNVEVEVSFGADKKTIIGHKCALAYEVFVRSENQSRPRMVKTEWKMCEFVAEGTDKPISSAPTKMMVSAHLTDEIPGCPNAFLCINEYNS